MPCHCVILGAGISGLSCAWYLKRKFGSRVQVTLLEKSPRVGGWIQTIHQDGFQFELGPRSCRSKGTGLHTLQLIEELNFQDQVILSDDSARVRYRYIHQKLQKLPHHFSSFLFSPLAFQIGRAIGKDLITPRGTGDDESVEAFFTRRFGRDIAEQFADPLVSGIYAGDIRKLSLKACFPLLYQAEQEHRSVLKGMLCRRSPSVAASPFIQSVKKSPIFSFKEGLGSFVSALSRQLDADIRLNCAPVSLELASDGVKLRLSDQSLLDADYVFSTLPAYAIGELLKPAPLSALLSQISYASVGIVCLGYRRAVLKEKGFGYLIPSLENQAILGCVWDSCVFPQHNQQAEETRLTVMMGGMRHPEVANYSPQTCVRIALDALQKHLGIQEPPQTSYVNIAKQAIPQYEIGHGHLLGSIAVQNIYPRLKLLGTAFHGVSMSDCIMKSKKIVEEVNLD